MPRDRDSAQGQCPVPSVQFQCPVPVPRLSCQSGWQPWECLDKGWWAPAASQVSPGQGGDSFCAPSISQGLQGVMAKPHLQVSAGI